MVMGRRVRAGLSPCSAQQALSGEVREDPGAATPGPRA